MGFITNIQKFAIHDGDGIRTTVFFKGCELRCIWCHNPETQNYHKELLCDEEKCIGCGMCASVCPSQAIQIIQEKAVTDRELCNICQCCVLHCSLNLRKAVGEEYTVEQLFYELQKDELFYEESGGGVTLSGGEVMNTDIEYVEELVKKLYDRGISVMIDTCGQAPFYNFERILPYVDTFLYDIKVINQSLHKKYTGVGNEQILCNLEKLSSKGAKIYIRIPVIREVNGTVEGMKEISDYLLKKRIHISRVYLLPYHTMGSSKYHRIGREYLGKNLHTPSEEEMHQLVNLFVDAGFHNTRLG